MKPTQGNHTKIKRFEIFQDQKNLTKYLEDNFTESLKQMIKVTIKTLVKSEMEEFRQQLEDKEYFNGYYNRNLISSYGKFEDIPVPRFRKSQQGLQLNTLNIFDQEQGKFMQLIEQMHLLGISQRKIKQLVNTCFGFSVGTKQIGKVYEELINKEEYQINSKPINDTFEYILFDGIWEKVKGYGWSNNQKVLLCALGIRPNGNREIIGFKLMPNEDGESWCTLLKDLKDRGLKTDSVKLIIGDGHAGLKGALNKYFSNTPFQSCIVHKMRNTIGKTSSKNKAIIARDLHVVFESKSKEDVENNSKSFVKKWYMIEPKAIESFRFNLEDCFTYFSFEQENWTKIRTTNILEREFREVRRRFRVFDNTFQSEESANKYANGIFSYLNSNYPLK